MARAGGSGGGSDDPLDVRLREREQRERSRERNRRESEGRRSIKMQRAVARSQNSVASTPSPSPSSSTVHSPSSNTDVRLSLKSTHSAQSTMLEEHEEEDEEEEEEEAEEREEEKKEEEHSSDVPLSSHPPLRSPSLTVGLLSSRDPNRTVHVAEAKSERGSAVGALSQQRAPSPTYRPLSQSTASTASASSPSSTPSSSSHEMWPTGVMGLDGGSRAGVTGVELYDRPLDRADPFSRASSSSTSSSSSFPPSLPLSSQLLRGAFSHRLQRLTEQSSHFTAEQLQRWLTRLQRGDDDNTDTETETETEGEGEWTDGPHPSEGSFHSQRSGRTANDVGLPRSPPSNNPSDTTHMYNGEEDGESEVRERDSAKHKRWHRGGRRRRPRESTSSEALHNPPPPAVPSYLHHPALAHSSSSSPVSLLSSPTSSPTSSSSTASPSRLPPSSMVHRDWNEEFQSLLSLVNDDETVLDNQSAFEQLSELAADFAFTARALGRLIISEKYLSTAEKTIKPTGIGGIAGGEKFVVHNIVFKFQVDHLGLYGSDDSAAMTAGNHELLGLSAYYRVISTMKGLGIHVPLACLIDYRGFRLWAVSRLPIHHTDTLILGSNDGGKRVVNLDPNVSKSMERIASVLNLKGHYIQDETGKQTFLFGPFDIEGHRGYDGRAYLLDFHRTFPPEPLHASQHLPLKKPYLVRMLRPELVRQNLVPLSSDAFMRGGAVEEEEVDLAYQSLLDRAIPAFAAQLDALGSIDRIERISALYQQSTERHIRQRALQGTPSRLSTSGEVTAAEDQSPMDNDPSPSPFGLISRAPSPAPSADPPSPGPTSRILSDPTPIDCIAFSGRFISYLHQAGINIRYLGLLRRAVTTPSIKDFLLVEMLARVLKGDMRGRWRAKMASVKHISDGVYRRCSIDFVNLVFLRSPFSTQYWKEDIRRHLLEKFTQALTPEEAAPNFDLKASLLPIPDDRDSALSSLYSTAPSVPSQNEGRHGGLAPSAYDPSHLYFLSPSHERRLQKLMKSTSQGSSTPPTPSGTPPPIAGSGAAEPPSSSSSHAFSPSVAQPSSLSSGPTPRVDLLRLVFLRFIHLTGLEVQEGLISGSHLIYNQPTVPLPLAHQRWDERRRSGTWEPTQFATEPTGASRPASPSSSSSSPSLPATHPLSLPPRLPTTSGSGLRRTSNSSTHLPTLPNLRSQTTQPQSSMHRSTSSSSLHPQSSHRPSTQFPFNSLSSSHLSPNTVDPPLESPSSSFTASPFFQFYERPMEDLHLSSISEQVKSLNIVSYAEGTALLCKCVSKKRREDGSSADDEQNSALTRYLADLSQAKFRESLRRDVDDCLSLCNWSMLTSLVYNDKELAKGLLLSALRANHRHHRSWYYLAQLFAHDLKEPRVADWLYRTALKLNPFHVNSHKDYGNLLLFAHRDSVKAELHYRTAVDLQPNHIKALIALGGCLARKAKVWKDFEEVVDCWRKAANSNYGDHSTRRTAQQTFVSMLTIKGQLHADRREMDRARQCLEEAITFRPPPLLPHQVQQSSQVGLHFPPASALVVFAQFERLQGRMKRAEGLFLQAIAVQTQLKVDVEANCLILPTPTPFPSTTSVASSVSTASVGNSSSTAPQHSSASVHGKASSVPLTQLPSTSVWAMGGPSLSTAGPNTPSSASAATTESAIKVHREPQLPTLSTTSLASASPSVAPPSVAAPPSAAVTSAPTASPASSTSTSSSKQTAVNVWKQRRQWLPDSTPSTALPPFNQPRRGGTPTRRSSTKDEIAIASALSSTSAVVPAPSPSPLASAASVVSVLPSNTSPRIESSREHGLSGSEEGLEKDLGTEGDSVLREGSAVEDIEESLESPFPPSSEAEGEDEEEEASRDLRKLAGAVSPSPDLPPPSSTPHRRRSSVSQYQAEAAEKAEEERREKSCVDTSIIRLYADHLHRFRPEDPDSAERWYRTALSLSSFGRSGSLNLASYADFLGRRRHFQFEAQRVFQRSISSPCPAPEALFKYAAYLRDVILDKDMADKMITEAEAMKKVTYVGHRCHRTRAGWYCDKYCDSRVVKPMIDAAKHWGKSRPERPQDPPINGTNTAIHRNGGLSPAVPPTAAPPAHGGNGGGAFVAGPPPSFHSTATAPPPKVTTVFGSVTVSPPSTSSANASKAPASVNFSPSVAMAVSPRAAAAAVAGAPLISAAVLSPLPTSPLLSPAVPASSLQQRSSWSDVCKQQLPAQATTHLALTSPHTTPPSGSGGSGGTRPSSPSSSPSSTAHSAPVLAVPLFHSMTASANPSAGGSPSSRMTTLPVFRPRPQKAAPTMGVANASTAAPTRPPAVVSAAPLPLPMPFPAPSPSARHQNRK